jgi:hypothetical protein
MLLLELPRPSDVSHLGPETLLMSVLRHANPDLVNLKLENATLKLHTARLQFHDIRISYRIVSYIDI